jgi:hypothetical protein
MSGSSSDANPVQHAGEDFAGEYEALLKQAAVASPRSAIGFGELKAAVQKEVDAEDSDEGCSLMLEFDDFDAFFDWFDVVSAYDQMDAEFKISIFKPLLEVVYRSLIAEYRADVQANACLPETPAATRQLVDQLQEMHPDRLWGTSWLGDYAQFADPDAPEIIIFFSLAFDANRFEVTDPYSDAYGSEGEPSIWKLPEKAANLIRGHNKIYCSRSPSR